MARRSGDSRAVAWVAAASITLAACIQRISIANNILQFGFPDDLTTLKANDDEIETAFNLEQITLLFAGLFFLAWLYQARANSDTLGLYRSRWSQRWLAYAWFIPGINLRVPLRIVSDLWRGSDRTLPRDKWPRPGLVVAWWITWLCYPVGFLIASSTEGAKPEAASQIRMFAFVGVCAVAASIISTVLAAVVVWKISLLQHSHRVGPACSAPIP